MSGAKDEGGGFEIDRDSFDADIRRFEILDRPRIYIRNLTCTARQSVSRPQAQVAACRDSSD